MSSALLKSLQEGRSEEPLRVLYRTYSGELYGFALSSLGDRGLAEELVQEVFTRVWRHADSYDPDRASFRTWLYGIARNAIIDFKRRSAVRPSLALHEPTEEAARPTSRSSSPCCGGRWRGARAAHPGASPR